MTDAERILARAELELERRAAMADWYGAAMAGAKGGLAQARRRILALDKRIAALD